MIRDESLRMMANPPMLHRPDIPERNPPLRARQQYTPALLDRSAHRVLCLLPRERVTRRPEPTRPCYAASQQVEIHLLLIGMTGPLLAGVPRTCNAPRRKVESPVASHPATAPSSDV